MQYQAKTFRPIYSRAVTVLLFLFFLISCSERGESYKEYIMSDTAEMMTAEAASEPPLSRQSASVTASLSSKAGGSIERKKSYRAGCTMKAADPESVITEIALIIKKYDGVMESVNGGTAVLKVPVENLEEAFKEIKNSSELVSEFIEAEDVTDYYFDIEGRIRLLEKSRNRFHTLLKYENDTENKVKILKEIKRINDELEGLRNSLSSLEKKIKYAEIVVTLLPYHDYSVSRDIPFRWIADLDPYRSTVKEVLRQLKIRLPDDFAVLRHLRYFHGETSDGTTIRIGTVRNVPEGDTEFWQKALLNYMSRFYSRSDSIDIGNIRGVLFYQESRLKYRYFAGTSIKGPLLYIIEVFYPDEEKL